MAPVMVAMFPLPPISATNRPPGLSAWATAAATSCGGDIQCSAALEKTASTGSSSAKSSPWRPRTGGVDTTPWPGQSSPLRRRSPPLGRRPWQFALSGLRCHTRDRRSARRPRRQQLDYAGAQFGDDPERLVVKRRVPAGLGRVISPRSPASRSPCHPRPYHPPLWSRLRPTSAAPMTPAS